MHVPPCGPRFGRAKNEPSVLFGVGLVFSRSADRYYVDVAPCVLVACCLDGVSWHSGAVAGNPLLEHVFSRCGCPGVLARVAPLALAQVC